MQHKTKRWGLLLVNCNGLFARFRVLITIRFWTFASQSCPHDSKQGPGMLQVYVYKWAARHGHFAPTPTSPLWHVWNCSQEIIIVSWYRDCGRLNFNSLMTCEQLFLSKKQDYLVVPEQRNVKGGIKWAIMWQDIVKGVDMLAAEGKPRMRGSSLCLIMCWNRSGCNTRRSWHDMSSWVEKKGKQLFF